jgi:hypothetical protein
LGKGEKIKKGKNKKVKTACRVKTGNKDFAIQKGEKREKNKKEKEKIQYGLYSEDR